MDIKAALKGQYHAAFEMLREAVEKCPDDVWVSGSFPRSYWRIVYHAIFYSHLYLGQNEEVFVRWEKGREGCEWLWADEEESPEVVEPYTRAEVLNYLTEVDLSVDRVVDGLDLEAENTGYSWYKSMNKLDHQMMNLRHLQGHVGQLSEILMQHGIETSWVGKRPREQALL